MTAQARVTEPVRAVPGAAQRIAAPATYRPDIDGLREALLSGDIGRLKVESAEDRISELNPDVTVTTYPFALTAENIEAVLCGTMPSPGIVKNDSDLSRRERFFVRPLARASGLVCSSDTVRRLRSLGASRPEQ